MKASNNAATETQQAAAENSVFRATRRRLLVPALVTLWIVGYAALPIMPFRGLALGAPKGEISGCIQFRSSPGDLLGDPLYPEEKYCEDRQAKEVSARIAENGRILLFDSGASRYVYLDFSGCETCTSPFDDPQTESGYIPDLRVTATARDNAGNVIDLRTMQPGQEFNAFVSVSFWRDKDHLWIMDFSAATSTEDGEPRTPPRLTAKDTDGDVETTEEWVVTIPAVSDAVVSEVYKVKGRWLRDYSPDQYTNLPAVITFAK